MSEDKRDRGAYIDGKVVCRDCATNEELGNAVKQGHMITRDTVYAAYHTMTPSEYYICIRCQTPLGKPGKGKLLDEKEG